MFKPSRTVPSLVALAAVVALAFLAPSAKPATPNLASVTDCTTLRPSNASLTVSNAANFRKKGHTYYHVSTVIEGIPAGYTAWELLVNKGRCYMHSMTGNTPVTAHTFGLHGSVAKFDIAGLNPNFTDSRVYYTVLIAGPGDSKQLESFAQGSAPAADQLVPGFGADTYRVNRDQIEVDTLSLGS